MKDIHGKEIKVGDILKSEWGYQVKVIESSEKKLTGKLICENGHSCQNIPYSLNDGNGHEIIK